MIGYDIDGVLCQDLHPQVFDRFGDELMYSTRSVYLPLFKPDGEWIAITGRTMDDKVTTEKWFAENFKENPPLAIYFNQLEWFRAVEHKASIINKLEISHFIESDILQVLKLRELCHRTKIVHFEEMIKQSIKMSNIR